MSPPWYVWMVGSFVEVDGEVVGGIVGVYSTEAKAEAAAQPGERISLIAVDDTAAEVAPLPVRWVE